jgi:hypothetical protein
VAGGALGYWFQHRAWAHQHEIQLRDEEHQHEVQRREEEHQRALKTFEEVSQLLDRRLYRMRLLYWAARERVRRCSLGRKCEIRAQIG